MRRSDKPRRFASPDERVLEMTRELAAYRLVFGSLIALAFASGACTSRPWGPPAAPAAQEEPAVAAAPEPAQPEPAPAEAPAESAPAEGESAAPAEGAAPDAAAAPAAPASP